MICGLFSIFDPHSLLWGEVKLFLSSFLLLTLTSVHFYPVWMGGMMSEFFRNMFKSVSLSMKSYRQGFLLLISVFLLIFVSGIEGLIPFSFALSAHMVVTLSLSLPLWLSGVLQSVKFSPSSFVAHLLPSGSPAVLWPFLVFVELISLIIRPLTLAVRLMANVTAGHLILSLASSGVGVFTFPFSFLLSCGILGFEVCISIVQAFVFFSLLSLYWGES